MPYALQNSSYLGIGITYWMQKKIRKERTQTLLGCKNSLKKVCVERAEVLRV